MANSVYLSLGTNLGNRLQNLQIAVDALGEIAAVEAISPVYQTAPWGVENQPDFFNVCLKVRTLLQPESLLASCHAIEEQMGRVRGEKWGPRIIDIDLIFFNDLIRQASDISIPHPQLDQRAFVLVPLHDIAPDLIDPRDNRTLKELIQSTDVSTVERLDEERYRLLRPANFAWGVKTFIMGIINVTPDSFSDDGIYETDYFTWRLSEMAKAFVAQGADILDLGGESTRPGGKPISTQEELDRVIPAIEMLSSQVSVPISVDTYKSEVAKSAVGAGARWINDIWGFRMDPSMAAVAAEADCPVVLMHNRSKPKDVSQEEKLGGRYIGVHYDNLLEDIREELLELAENAERAGIHRERIILDPGIGFGKTVAQNLRLLDEMDRIVDLGYPVLVGPSRKSFIGYTLKLPPDMRVEGTAATVAIAIDRGVDIVRVHDVETMARVARMSDSIVRS